MVLELVKLGSLLEFITSQPGSVSEDIELPLWVREKWIEIMKYSKVFLR